MLSDIQCFMSQDRDKWVKFSGEDVQVTNLKNKNKMYKCNMAVYI